MEMSPDQVKVFTDSLSSWQFRDVEFVGQPPGCSSSYPHPLDVIVVVIDIDVVVVVVVVIVIVVVQ